MKAAEIVRVGRFLSAFVVSFALAACSGGGSTDGGEAADNADKLINDHFVADDDSVGRIELELVDTEVEVSRLTGYFVRVIDANGHGVPNIKVSCDTEEGVAVVEPTTGTEITDSQGSISGKFGCEVPGSFQVACRVPVGANKRTFASIKCVGDIPAGFTGFPGAAGGGLGTGGVSDGDNGGIGGTDPDGVSMTSISADDGTGAGPNIDTVAGTCTGTPPTAEPFFDTRFTIKVTNNSNSRIRFNAMYYVVSNATGAGTGSFTSGNIGLIGDVAGGGGEGIFDVLAFDAQSDGSTTGKAFFGSASLIPSSLGFRTLTVYLTGQNDQGDQVTVTGRIALSFDNYNNC